MRSRFAVGDGPGPVPAAEDGLDGAAQLVRRVLGERLAGVALDDLLVGVDQVAQQLGGHLGVRGGAGQLLGRVEEGVELLARELEHDAPVHGDEAAVGVEGEALVAGLLGQTLDRAVVEAEVEDGVHHAGHGELGPRAHRDEQRVVGVADRPCPWPSPGGSGPRPPRRRGPWATPGHVGPAGVGRDGEPGGTGRLEYRRHLGQVGALAAQEVLELHRAGVRACGRSRRRTASGLLALAWRTACERRSLGGRSRPDLGGTPHSLPARRPPSVSPWAASSGRRSARPRSIWRSKTSLASRMKSRTIASSSALKRWVTCFISSTMGCCSVCEPLLGRRHQLHPDPAAVVGVPSPLHHAGLLEPVEEEGHRPGASARSRRRAGRRSWAEASQDVEAAHVGPAQLELLGHPLVEVAGRAEVPDDLRSQLGDQVAAATIALTRK